LPATNSFLFLAVGFLGETDRRFSAFVNSSFGRLDGGVVGRMKADL
jgi:hypothetical protein